MVEDVEDTQLKSLQINISRFKQWNLKHTVQWMHVTKDGHIYTANIFGGIDLHHLSGKLLYQWERVPLRGITSVTVDKKEYIVVVVKGLNESGTVLRVTPIQSRFLDDDQRNEIAYETQLDSDTQTPLCKLQNGCIALGLKVSNMNDATRCQVHVLECSSIPFKCVSTVDISSSSVVSLCGIVSNDGLQLIACVTAFDGVKRPIVVYSLNNNEEIWRFTGHDVMNFETRRELDQIRKELRLKSEVQAGQSHPLIPEMDHLSPSLPTVQQNRIPFHFPMDPTGLQTAGPVLRQPSPIPFKHGLPILMDISLKFLATDICAMDAHSIFVAEANKQEVLMVDNSGRILGKFLTKEDLVELAVDYMQYLLPSRYLVTVCSPRPIKALDRQIMIIWKFKAI